MWLSRPEELGPARLFQSAPGTQTASTAWWALLCCPGDLKVVFGKSPGWCWSLPRHHNDSDIGKGKGLKLAQVSQAND